MYNKTSSGNRSFGGSYGSQRRGTSFSRGGTRPAGSSSGAPRSGGYRGNGGGFRRGGNRIVSWSVSELMRIIETEGTRKVTEAPVEFVAKHTFNDFDIVPELKRNIISKGYLQPTPIQDLSIPAMLEGRDLIGHANTGTGKTAAFLIPLINKVFKNHNEKVLIITPTRELSLQIFQEFMDFSRNMRMYTALCIGGTNIYKQKMDLKRNPSFVIGTPGRLRDLIRQHVLDLSHFSNVVLDEVDQMVDIGFVNEIKYFISLLPAERQSLFFSATTNGKVSEILRTFVKDPVTVNVKSRETSANIEQKVVHVPQGKRKIDVLSDILSSPEAERVLVFGRTKFGVQDLEDELIKRGFRAGAIHGNKKQSQRQRILSNFKENVIKVLLATDVASRGLDIKNVSHVINYEMPENYQDYVHRIGRTGRANKKGIALTIVG